MTEIQNVKSTESIGTRLQKLIRHYNYNMNSFSIKLGLSSNSVITRVVNDPKRGMSLEYLQRILTEFPEVSARWLILNEGEMLRASQQKQITTKPDNEDCANCAKLKEKEDRISSLEQDKRDLRANILDLRCSVENLREIGGLQKKAAG